MFQRQIFSFIILAASLSTSFAHPPVSNTALRATGFVNVRYDLEPPTPAPLPPKPAPQNDQYNMDVVMDYARHSLSVEQTIVFHNRSGAALTSLTLAVPPNFEADVFELTIVAINEIETEYLLNKHRMDIPLQNPLEVDSALRLTLRYNIALPYRDRSNSVAAPLFGYTDAQTNLVNWYPFIVPNIGGEWRLNEPVSFGDTLVYPIADYDINFVFIGEKPVIAASGDFETIGEITHYSLKNARSFALSLSPNFQVVQKIIGDISFSSYFLPPFRKQAEAALQTSINAIGYFSEQFGDYPYSTYSIVQSDLGDSREFSGISFLSHNAYSGFDGTPKSALTYTSIHAASHQWWGGMIGNDPALEPWLDEALATYSECLYIEAFHPDMLKNWRSNRVEFFRPQGNIDATIYQSGSYNAYKRSAVLNGYAFLYELRGQMGSNAFAKFLRDYAAQGRAKIFSTSDFFNVLSQHASGDYSGLIAKYFLPR